MANMQENPTGVFETLNALNINGHTETKNVSGKDLTYLSWPWAWAEVKKRYPDAHYTIWKNENGLPYTEDPLTGYMVYTSVTIDGITHEMWLPVMDGANKAMRREAYEYKTKYNGMKTCEAATMMDINKSIMRCLVKNLAMFGLGLYIYAGEDLPEVEKEQEPPKQTPPKTARNGGQGVKITTADKLPASAQQGPQGAENGAQNAPETVGAYISRRLAEMKAIFPGFDFVTARKELIADGKVKDVPSATIKMEEAKTLMEEVYGWHQRKAG